MKLVKGGRSLRPHRPRGGLQQFWKLKHLRENLYEKSRQVSILLKNIKPDQKLPQLLGLVFSLQPDISIPNGSFFRFFDINFVLLLKLAGWIAAKRQGQKIVAETQVVINCMVGGGGGAGRRMLTKYENITSG